MLDPALHVQRLGRRVDVVGEGQPAAGVGEGGEPPGGGLVAGAVLVVVEGDEDAGGRAAGGRSIPPGGRRPWSRWPRRQCASPHAWATVKASISPSTRTTGLSDVEAVGVEQGVAEAGGPEVFWLPGGDLRGRDRAAHVDAPEGAAGEPGDGDATGEVDALGGVVGRRQAPVGVRFGDVLGVVADVVAVEGVVGQAAGVQVGEGPGAFGAKEADGTAGDDAAAVGLPAGGGRGERGVRSGGRQKRAVVVGCSRRTFVPPRWPCAARGPGDRRLRDR